MLSIFSDKNAIKIAPSTILFTVFLLFSLFSLYYLRSIVLLVFLSFIVMIALNPISMKLREIARLSKIQSIIASYVVVLGGLFLLIALVLPPLISEVVSLLRALNLPIFADYLRNITLSVQEINSLISRVSDSFSLIVLVSNMAFNGVFYFVMLIVLSFYLKMERDDLPNKLYWFTNDPKHIDLAGKILDEVELQMGGWVRVKVLLMFVIGITTYLGLLLVGVDYALPLAVLAGLLEVIPNIGPIAAAVPAVIIAFLTGGWVFASVVALLYLIIQQLENSVLVPRLMKNSVNVNPFVTLIIVLAGFQAAGVSGALLSLPTYLIIRVIYKHLIIAKRAKIV